MQAVGTAQWLPTERRFMGKHYCCSPRSADTCSSQDDCNQSLRVGSSVSGPPATVETGMSTSDQRQRQKRTSDHPTKEKSQLCKTFVEHGYCPYNQKCKFAHGSHQLRQNQEFNSRYKTKECGSYFKLGYCMYGIRCNFVHRGHPTDIRSDHQQAKWQQILQQHRELIYETRHSSRLLRLLGTATQEELL